MLSKSDKYKVALLILLQRTDIQGKFKSRFITRIDEFSGGVLSLIWVLVEALHSTQVISAYDQANQINSFDINTLISKIGFSQEKSFMIADIGSGIGGYHKEWLTKFPEANVLLIDQTKFSFTSLFYGHGKPERYYNNLALAQKYLLSTGDINPKQIHLLDTRLKNDKLENCEIIISFISLGFHYHLETYWDMIWSSSKAQVLLVDIRIGSQSEYFLFEKSNLEFKVDKISSGTKSHRWAVSRFS